MENSKSKKVIIGVIVAAVIIALGVVAFFILSSNPKQQILGMWAYDGTGGMTITFNGDGSAVLTNGSGTSLNIAYAVQDNNDLVLNYVPGITSDKNKTYKYDSSAKNATSVGGEIWYIEGDHLYIGNDRLTKIAAPNYSDDAKTLGYACKEVYAGVMAGVIDKGTTDANGNSCEWAAESGVSSIKREEKSKEITIANVQQYKGTSFDISFFVYATDDIESASIHKGTILYENDEIVKANSSYFSKLTSSTTLGELFK